MFFKEAGIQCLVMLKHFIFLIKFNVATHHNDGLPHEKHEHTTYECQHQNGDAAHGDDAAKTPVKPFHPIGENVDQRIGLAAERTGRSTGQQQLHFIYHVRRNLWRQNGKIVGNDDEQHTSQQSVAVLPEIFIDGFQVLHEGVKVLVPVLTI